MSTIVAKSTEYAGTPPNPKDQEILDFLPLANVDYSGGIITTDWYNEGINLGLNKI